MWRTKSSDSSAVPGSMWSKSRSSEKEPIRTRLGGSWTGCEGTRSISITILSQIADSGVTVQESVAHVEISKEENADAGPLFTWRPGNLVLFRAIGKGNAVPQGGVREVDPVHAGVAFTPLAESAAGHGRLDGSHFEGEGRRVLAPCRPTGH